MRWYDPSLACFSTILSVVQVKMREMEKAMRQVEKGGSHHALVSRQFSEAALLSPTGRTGSGRTTPTGKLMPPGTTHSGSTTPTGRNTPRGTASGLSTPTGRITPPGRTPVTGRSTPPGMQSGLTTPTGSLTPYGTTTSGRSSPVAAVSATQQAQGDECKIASTAVVASGSGSHNTAADRAVACTAVDVSRDVKGETDAEAEGLVPRLLSSRSSVKDAVALWEVSHPVSSRKPSSGNRLLLPFSDGQTPANGDGQLPFSDRPSPISGHRQLPFGKRQAPVRGDRQLLSGDGQASASSHRQLPFNGQAPISGRQHSTGASLKLTQTTPDADVHTTRLVTSQSPYQTRSLSESVYGKLYSSESSIDQDAISAAWKDDHTTNEHHIGSGTGISGSGRQTAIGSGAVAGSGIGRFGGGIGRGSSTCALQSKPGSEGLSADSVLVNE